MPNTNPFIVPGAPSELQAKINATRAQWAGLKMMAGGQGENAEQQQSSGETPKDGNQSDDFKSPESKSAVLADLADERRQRQALQAEMADLKPLREQMAKLAEVFGSAPDANDGGEQLAEMVQQMRHELDTMRADKLRLETAQQVAAAKKLATDDIALLATLPDKEAMEQWADRLTSSPSSPYPPRTPLPDRSAGAGAGSSRGRATSVAQAKEDYLARQTKKQ